MYMYERVSLTALWSTSRVLGRSCVASKYVTRPVTTWKVKLMSFDQINCGLLRWLKKFSTLKNHAQMDDYKLETHRYCGQKVKIMVTKLQWCCSCFCVRVYEDTLTCWYSFIFVIMTQAFISRMNNVLIYTVGVQIIGRKSRFFGYFVTKTKKNTEKIPENSRLTQALSDSILFVSKFKV